MFWHNLLTSSSFGSSPAQEMLEITLSYRLKIQSLAFFNNFAQNSVALILLTRTLFETNHQIWCYTKQSLEFWQIWKRQVEFSLPSANKWSLHQEVQQKIGKANDCSFNTNALSELLMLLQTRNSNHSMNQSQSISQACLWQTEDLETKKKELLARHVLQACFCSPSLLRWSEQTL